MNRDADTETLERLERFRQRSMLDAHDAALVSKLGHHIATTGSTPDAYIVQALTTHDVVFLGEDLPTEQSGQFIAGLIEHLAAAGVWHFGAEWLLHDDQAHLDAIVTAPEFDEIGALDAVVRWGMRHGLVPRSRVDVLRAAWEVNQHRDRDAPAFRILGLDYELYYDNVTDRADLTTPEAWPHLRTRGPAARFMAAVIDAEIMRPRHRAVVSCSTTNALTHHRRPHNPSRDRYDVERNDDHVLGTANHLFAQRADRVTTVLMHQPFPADPATGADLVYAAGGLIDMAFARADGPKFPVGFDISLSPLAVLPNQLAHDAAPLGRLAHGWVFLDPLQRLDAPIQVSDQLESIDLADARRRMLHGAHRRPDNDIEQIRGVVDTAAGVIEMKLRSVGA